MKKSLFQKALCLLLSVTTLLGLLSLTAAAAVFDDKNYHASNNDTASTREEMTALVGIPTYAEYLAKYSNSPASSKNKPLFINVVDDIVHEESTGNAVKVSESLVCQDYKTGGATWDGFSESDANSSVYLPAQGKTTWKVEIPNGAEGYYYIKFDYYSCFTADSSVSSIERKLYINGVSPFKEVSYITFDKSWTYDYGSDVEDKLVGETDKPDGQEVIYDPNDDGYYKIVRTYRDGKIYERKYVITQDINDNSMLPEITQMPQWSTYYCQDSSGYVQGYFKFYFLGDSEYQISLEAEREPVIVKSIELVPAVQNETSVQSYNEYLAQAKKDGFTAVSGGNIIKLEAEFPDLVSDSSVYATNDNSNSATFPSAPDSQLYNVIGENSYSSFGQWAAYKFTVSKTGFYKVFMRYLQSQLQGMYICRTIKLSGGQYGDTPVVPFFEAYDAQFDYSKDWQSTYISDSNGTEFEFAFEAGKEYTIYIECSLGSLKDIIETVEGVQNTVNKNYLKILQLTGSSPDEYRDYGFIKIMPEVLISLIEQAGILMDVKEELIELCGTNGSHLATLETVAILLNMMGQDEGDNIAANLSNLKSYLGTLGTWINDSKKGTLILDTIVICPSELSEEDVEELPEAKAGFFKSMWFEITSFIYSFFTDYEAMGLTKEPDENTVSIDVWLAAGRDQSNIWRTMIDADNGYTDMTGYSVNLKLVTATTLLPSILSGKGPDVYMGLGAADVINYAIRDAIIGINGKDKGLQEKQNEIFKTTYYIYKDKDGNYHDDETDAETAYKNAASPDDVFVSQNFENVEADCYVKAATDTLELIDVVYGVPQTMGFAMMFYRMDVLADLDQPVPETWGELLSLLPTLQSNNMQIGVSYIHALDFMIYQKGGSMWKYEDEELYDPIYAGAKIDLDSDVALESFEFVCRLYSDYSFPVSYDASNRFRTGEMPIIIGDYASTYNTLVVFATEIAGLWEFCPLPGSEVIDPDTGKVVINEQTGKKEINYNSLANVTATVMLHGCDNIKAAWTYLQWQTSAEVQADYGNKMVALIGPSAKYEAANVKAIDNLSWTASERDAIKNQMANLSSIVNYPGSYITARYMQFAFLDAVNDGVDAVDALTQYIDAINAEISRKREEFELPTFTADQEPPTKQPSSK